MEINKYLTKRNYTKMNNPNRVKYIVIHYVGALSGAEANCHYFYSTYRGASAHYFVGYQGEIWQCVEDADMAWHCGSGHHTYKNENSIGIEMCVRKKSTKTMYATDKDWYFEDATVDATVELTKMLMKKYNVPVENVIRHYDVSGKICPNPYVYNNTKHTWAEFKERISEQEPIKQPEKPATTTPTTPTNTLKLGDECKLVAGAKYVDGQSISSWVFDCKLYVRGFDNKGNIIISTLKTGAITGTVAAKYVVPYTAEVKVEEKPTTTTQKEEVKQEITTTELKKGDECRLLEGAVYTSGGKVPTWVIKSKLYVREIYKSSITVSTLKTGAITGTVDAKYVVPYGTSTTTTTEFTPYLVYIDTNVLNVRKGPNTTYGIATTVRRGGIYTIVDEQNGWGLLKAYKTGRNGWIYLDYTKKV